MRQKLAKVQLEPIQVGQPVLVLSRKTQWNRGKFMAQLSDRSYIMDMDGQILRRNRMFLRHPPVNSQMWKTECWIKDPPRIHQSKWGESSVGVAYPTKRGNDFSKEWTSCPVKCGSTLRREKGHQSLNTHLLLWRILRWPLLLSLVEIGCKHAQDELCGNPLSSRIL